MHAHTLTRAAPPSMFGADVLASYTTTCVLLVMFNERTSLPQCRPSTEHTSLFKLISRWQHVLVFACRVDRMSTIEHPCARNVSRRAGEISAAPGDVQ